MKDVKKIEDFDFFIELDNILLKYNNLDQIFEKILNLLIISNKNNVFLCGNIKINDNLYYSEDYKLTEKYYKTTIYLNDITQGEINIYVGKNEMLYQEYYNILKYTANRIGFFLESEFEKRRNSNIKKALDFLSNAVLITDESDIVVYANDNIYKMFDLKAHNDILERPLDIVLSLLSLEEQKTIIYSKLSEKGSVQGFINIEKDNNILRIDYKSRYLRDENGKSLCKIFFFENIFNKEDYVEENNNIAQNRELSNSTLTTYINSIVDIICNDIDKKNISLEKINILKEDLKIFSYLLNGEIILHEDEIELNSYLKRLNADSEIEKKYSNLLIEGDKYIFDRLWYELELLCNINKAETDLIDGNKLCIKYRINENERDISQLLDIYCSICGFNKISKDNFDIIEINITKNNSMKDNSNLRNIENISILIVEDNNATFKITELFLKQRKITNIQRASDGNEGIQKFKDNKYDIVFMDILMEGKNGIDCIVEMREYEKENGIKDLTPIIANSAFTDEKDIKRCFDAGCSDFLKKPINNESLIKITEKWTRKKI